MNVFPFLRAKFLGRVKITHKFLSLIFDWHQITDEVAWKRIPSKSSHIKTERGAQLFRSFFKRLQLQSANKYSSV